MAAKTSKPQSLGDYLREKRTERGISQNEVAAHLGYGSAQFVSNWERQLANPPMPTLRKLIPFLKLDTDELLDLLLAHSEAEIQAALIKGSRKVRL